MVIASEPGWLHAAGQAAGTILLLELGLALFIVAALMVGFAVAAWWLRTHVVPVVREHAPQALHAMQVAQQSSDRVVGGVAEFYGRRQQAETAVRVLLFGRKAAERVREESLVQAAEDLQMMAPPEEAEEAPGPENGFTPQPGPRADEIGPAARAAGMVSGDEASSRAVHSSGDVRHRAAGGADGDYNRLSDIAGNAV